jgi:hypothetical protein
VADRFEFGPPRLIDVKGKGSTPVRLLVGRPSDAPVTVTSTVTSP